MKKIYFDTNIFIYFVEQYNENERSFLQKIINQNEIFTSELTFEECLVNKKQETKDKYEQLIYNEQNIKVIKIDKEILKICSRIRSKYGIQLADAIHIATALKNKCNVIYTNDKDFKKVQEKESMPILQDLSKSINSLKETLKLQILSIEDIFKMLKRVSEK